MREYSSFALLPPRRIRPSGKQINTRQNTTNILPAIMNNQSKCSIDQLLATPNGVLAASYGYTDRPNDQHVRGCRHDDCGTD